MSPTVRDSQIVARVPGLQGVHKVKKRGGTHCGFAVGIVRESRTVLAAELGPPRIGTDLEQKNNRNANRKKSVPVLGVEGPIPDGNGPGMDFLAEFCWFKLSSNT